MKCKSDSKEFNLVELTDIDVAAGPIGKIIEDLEKRVAALEVLVQIQPTAKDAIDLPSLVDRVVEELRKGVRPD